MKALIVIDMQVDFTTGVLGNPQTAAVTAPVAALIRQFRAEEPDCVLIATLDTHTEDYLNTQEGRYLPVPHCLKGTDGWQLEPAVCEALGADAVLLEKGAFGSGTLPGLLPADVEEIHFCGVCTDICVISNAMIVKAAFPEVPLKIHAACCAGVTPESHENALSAMKMCQMDVI